MLDPTTAAGLLDVSAYSDTDLNILAEHGRGDLQYAAKTGLASNESRVALNMSDSAYQNSAFKISVNNYIAIQNKLDSMSDIQYDKSGSDFENELKKVSLPFKRESLAFTNWLKREDLFESRTRISEMQIMNLNQHKYMSFLLQEERFEELKASIKQVYKQGHGAYTRINYDRVRIYNLVNICQMNWFYMYDQYVKYYLSNSEVIDTMIAENKLDHFANLVKEISVTRH